MSNPLPEAPVPPAEALLDLAETGLGEARLFAALAAEAAHLPPDAQPREAARTKVLRQFLAIWRQLGDAALPAETRADLTLDLKRLHQKHKALSALRGVSEAAEALFKATDFAHFCALAPRVDLDRLQGSGLGKHSPFPLIWALSARDRPVERVALLLRLGARTDLRTRGQDTVLHAMAAMNRSAKARGPILHQLVAAGADLSARNRQDETPLEIALARGSVSDVAAFLSAGAPVGETEWKWATRDPQKLALLLDHAGESPESLAIAAGLGGWLRLRLAEAEADPKAAKTQAALAQSLARIASLPGYRPPADTGKAVFATEPAAFFALKSAPDLAAFRMALDRVDLSSMPTFDRDPPLFWPLLAPNDRPARMELMLQAGVAIAGDRFGSALHALAGQCGTAADGQADLVRLLLQAGLAIDAPGATGQSPLAVAVVSGGAAEVAALLAHGADPQGLARDRHGRLRPLLFPATLDAAKFRALIAAGADPTRPDAEGTTLAEHLALEDRRLAAELALPDLPNAPRRAFRAAQRAVRDAISLIEKEQGKPCT